MIEFFRKAYVLEEIAVKAVRVLTLALLFFILYWLGMFILNRLKPRLPEKGETQEIKKNKRILTMIALFKDTYKYILFFLGGFMILKEIGVDPAPMMATAGVIGLAIGFGAQSLIKDIVSGFFILFEGQYSVGDFVYLKTGPFEATGLVEEFGLRMTKVRDINGNSHFIPNGSIVGVSKYPRGYLSYHLDLFILKKVKEEELKEVLMKVIEEATREVPLLIASPKILEIKNIGSEKTLVRLKVFAIPLQEETVNRCANYFAQRLKDEYKTEEVVSYFYLLNEKAFSGYKKVIRPR